MGMCNTTPPYIALMCLKLLHLLQKSDKQYMDEDIQIYSGNALVTTILYTTKLRLLLHFLLRFPYLGVSYMYCSMILYW